ncbi:MAG TPA: DNA-binding domain-containing protein [Polyangiaceae bacterium]|nr:DNA-binding domain-containing protein [Polyangiaceae bacterium]
MNRQATADALGLHERASATPARNEPRAAALHGAASSWVNQRACLKWQQEWFTAIVTTPESEAAPVDADSANLLVTPSAHLSALERLEIYRRGYHARLVECLVDDYPVLQHALGEERFEALCRAYIARYPSHGPSLNTFGRHMAELCRTELRDAPGFHSDLAALEWAIVLSIHAPTASQLSLEDLAKMPAERWPSARLVPNPSLRILRFEHPVNAYLQAYRQGADPELGAPRENTLAVYRTGRSVWRLELGPALVVLVESLAYGATLADALGKVEPLLTGMPEAEAGALVMGWFQTSVSSGLFSALKAD